ncbi:MAG: DUF2283 domain-containing protein [Candidatus Hodarchaeales archaeon]
MKINYDPKADALYIKLSDKKIKETDESGKGLIIDYDENGDPVGIELLKASRLFGGKKEVSVKLSLTEAIKT